MRVRETEKKKEGERERGWKEGNGEIKMRGDESTHESTMIA